MPYLSHACLGQAPEHSAIVKEKCRVPIGRGAAESFSENQVHAQFTMISLVKSLSLSLYLFFATNLWMLNWLGRMRKLILVCNLKISSETEMNYYLTERYCLALILSKRSAATTCWNLPQSSREVQSSHVLICRASVSGRIARWMLQLYKFDNCHDSGRASKPSSL